MKASRVMAYRRDPPSRETLIAIGRRALEELGERPFKTSEASFVFEDGWRELAPSKMQYLADYLHESRGFFQEKGRIKFMIEWLENKPFEDAAERAETRIAKMLSRAWKAGIISREDEEYMPILKHLPNHIRYTLRRMEGFLRRGHKDPQPWLRPFLEREVIEQSFRLSWSKNAPVVRLAKRVANVIYEEGSRMT